MMLRTSFARLAALSIAALGTALLWSAPARADFRVCNATESLVGVAIGLRGTSGWVTEGWWHIDGSSCKTLLEGPLSSRYYYLYAEDAERGGRWSGPVRMCVANREFKIVGVNDCFARGYERAGFQEHDTGAQTSWMVQLSDEATAEPQESSETEETSPTDRMGNPAGSPVADGAAESAARAPEELGSPDVTPPLGESSGDDDADATD